MVNDEKKTDGNDEEEEDPVQRRIKGEKFARKTIERLWEGSALKDLSDKLPAFDSKEIKVGRLLGRGAFGAVFEIKAFELDETLQQDKRNHPKARSFLSEHCCREDGTNDPRYAVKRLTQRAINEPPRYIQAIVDMAIETRVLSNLDDHPHICKLRAVSASRNPFTQEYVLVLDRLYDTLESRIQIWDGIYNKYKNKTTRWFLDPSGKHMDELRANQLTSALQLCAALDHLHQHNIIYRDTKPENVGYDIRDDIKLFDFGLAKEIRETHKLKDGSGMYKLTGLTGSPRYMAPEVANQKPYNYTCDSYSFAILFHEMYSLTTPYDMFPMEVMQKQVWNGPHKRPEIQNKWSLTVRDMLKNSWCADHAHRWTIARIMEALNTECAKFGGVKGITVPDPKESSSKPKKTTEELRAAFQRRRSTFVYESTSSRNISSDMLDKESSTDNLNGHRSSLLERLMSGQLFIQENSHSDSSHDFGSDSEEDETDRSADSLTNDVVAPVPEAISRK